MNREKFHIFLGLCLALSLLIYAVWPTSMATFSYSSHDHGSISSDVPVAPIFRERSLELGVYAVHRESYEYLNGLDQTLGGGACILDFDNDGWFDLLIIAGTGQVHNYGRDAWWSRNQSIYLFRNQQGQGYIDVTHEAGFGDIEKGMGCAAGDLNNNGLVDVVITSIGQNYLFENKGDGEFRNVTSSSGFVGETWSTSVVIADYNRDGLQDIYVTNYVAYEKGGRRFEHNAGFEALVSGDFNPALFDPVPNKLYRNTGDMKFSDETDSAGVSDGSGRGLSAQWADVNEDDWPDLLVVNHTGSPNRLFLNDQSGGFRDASEALGVSSVSAGQASAVGDFNHDGITDFFISAGTGYAPALAIRKPEASEFIDDLWSYGLGNHASVNSSGWGAVVQDFNNDGMVDVFVNNGLITPDTDSPSLSQGQPNHFWFGQKNGFHREAGVLGRSSGRGVVSVDYDNDGDLDLILINNNDPVEFWVNQGNRNHWLGVILKPDPNAVAEPARIEVRTADRTLRKTSGATSTFLSQSEPRTLFGLGQSNRIEELVVHWSDGTKHSFQNIKPDRYIVVSKDGGLDTFAASQSPLEESYTFETLQEQFLPLYGKWLATTFHSEAQRKELLALYKSTDSNIRASVLAGLELRDAREVLPFLQLALESTQESKVIAGLELAQTLEAEFSVRWLLPLLSNSASGDLLCAAAGVFEHFFREEEAAVHRKMKAVSPLVRIIEGGKSEKATVCALRALAESEHYRALEPTITLLSSNNPVVRTEAARTLGLLRERAALTPLRNLLVEEDLTPATRATALVALLRLGGDPLNNGLFSPGDWQGSSEGRRHFLETILELRAGGTAGIAFDYRRLQKMLREFLETTPVISDTGTLMLAAGTILEFRNHEADGQLQVLMERHGDKAPRILEVALASGKLSDRRPFSDRLMVMPISARNDVLDNAGVLGFDIPLQELAALDLTSNEDLEFALRSLDVRHPASFIREVLQVALSMEGSSPTVKHLALRQCRRLRADNLSVPEKLFWSGDARTRALALRCMAIQWGGATGSGLSKMIRSIASAPDSSPVEISEAAAVIADLRPPVAKSLGVGLIRDSDAQPEFLVEMVTALAGRDSPVAPIIVRELMTHDNDLVRRSAMTVGYEALSAPARRRLSTAMVMNREETIENRIIAADRLLNEAPDVAFVAMKASQERE